MTPLTHQLSRIGRIVREILLSCAAIGGVVCIVFAILAFSGGYSLMLFKTGSMSPTIPAGSVALVQKVPASDVRVGDIVTVGRSGALPITHRIVSIVDGSTATERVITMRGDANPVNDPLPYTVNDVRIVRTSIPHLAPLLVQAGNPWVLGSLTLGAALLVSWAFWPRRSPAGVGGGPDAATIDAARPTVAATAPSRSLSSALLIIAGATLAHGALVAPAPASADTSSPLSIRSDLDGAGVQRLDSVRPLFWHLDIDAAAAPADGELVVSFSSTGEAEFHLHAEVRSCSSPWGSDGACVSGERVLRPRAPVPADGIHRELWASETPDVVYLSVALTANPDRQGGNGGASVTVRATAGEETADAGMGGEPDLAATGGNDIALVAAPAAVLIGVGVALVARHRRAKGKSR